MVSNAGNFVLGNGNGIYSNMATQQQETPSSSCAEYEFDDPDPCAVLSVLQYTESDVYSEPNITTEGRNRHTDTATSQPSLLNTALESQEYAQPHVTHTSGSIETAKNPAYGCTQPHVNE